MALRCELTRHSRRPWPFIVLLADKVPKFPLKNLDQGVNHCELTGHWINLRDSGHSHCAFATAYQWDLLPLSCNQSDDRQSWLDPKTWATPPPSSARDHIAIAFLNGIRRLQWRHCNPPILERVPAKVRPLEVFASCWYAVVLGYWIASYTHCLLVAYLFPIRTSASLHSWLASSLVLLEPRLATQTYQVLSHLLTQTSGGEASTSS